MGRRRQSRRDLPERVYQKHGAYYFVDMNNKWQKIGKSVSEVYRWYADMIHDDIQIFTMSQIMDRYLGEVLTEKAESTKTGEQRFIANLRGVFGDMQPQDIKPADIYRYMDIRAKKSGKATANCEKAALSNVFNAAIRWGLVEKNPCKEVKRISQKHRSHRMTDEEFQLIYDNASPTIKCIMDIAYLTGLRKGDILKLKLSDIKNDELLVETEKTKKKLCFKVEGDLAAAIDKAKKLRRLILSPYLFCTKEGSPITKSNFGVRWHLLKKRVGLSDDVVFHDIRGKAVTDASEQGINAQKLLGHELGIQTERYIKQREFEKVTPLKKKQIVTEKSENIRQ
jgi:integrase